MSARFVNRQRELSRLDAWWTPRGPRLGVVWGRRRVGKTSLIQHFAADRRTVFHTGTRRPADDELRSLSASSAPFVERRDLTLNPFRDWSDLFDALAEASRPEPLLLVLDEFPELVAVSPELPSVIRAAWERRAC